MSERTVDAIHEQVDGWFDEFINSPQYQPLTEPEKTEAPHVVDAFTEHAFAFLDQGPEDWNSGTVRECCLELLPGKVTAEPVFFQAVAPVLSAFFSFLAEKGLLGQARALATTVSGLAARIVAVSGDEGNWGPAKSFAMAALEAGVDLRDNKAIDRFMATYNLRFAARTPFPPMPMPATPPQADAPTAPPSPARRSGPSPGRNDPCPCGSGKKFKKCCGR